MFITSKFAIEHLYYWLPAAKASNQQFCAFPKMTFWIRRWTHTAISFSPLTHVLSFNLNAGSSKYDQWFSSSFSSKSEVIWGYSDCRFQFLELFRTLHPKARATKCTLYLRQVYYQQRERERRKNDMVCRESQILKWKRARIFFRFIATAHW